MISRPSYSIAILFYANVKAFTFRLLHVQLVTNCCVSFAFIFKDFSIAFLITESQFELNKTPLISF